MKELHPGAATRSQAEARLHRQENTVKSMFEPTPAIVQPAESMKQLAAEINAAAAEAETHSRKGLEKYRVAGEKLIKAKSQCGHGKWLQWIKDNLEIGRDQARNYMNLARNWSKLQTRVGNLRDAFDILARSQAEDEKHFAVPERIQSILDSGDKMARAARKAVEAANAVQEAEESEAWKVSGPKKVSYFGQFRSAANTLEGTAPEECCPDCKGEEASHDNDLCQTCKGKGFLTHSEAEAMKKSEAK